MVVVSVISCTISLIKALTRPSAVSEMAFLIHQSCINSVESIMRIEWSCRARRPVFLLAALALVAGSGGERALSAQSAPKVYYACYVPLTGTVYRIKESDVKQACTSTAHVEFSWVDGANAWRVTDPAGGDLTGVLSNATVARLLGRALGATPPTAGQVLTFDGTAWVPTNVPGASFPAAAGDVSGTYPNLTVGRLQGTQLSATPPTTGQFLSFNGTVWQPAAPPGGGGVTSHGALTGLLNDDHPQYLIANGARTATDGFAVTGIPGVGAAPASGPGTRLMWYPGRAAFRAGTADGTEWDAVQIGQNSAAFGSGTTASGANAVAFGQGTTASGNLSTAFGLNTTASGSSSTAMGANASTNAQFGAFVYGDGSTTSSVTANAANEFVVRASGGFRLRTAPDLSTGCDIVAGALTCTGKVIGANFGSNTTASGLNAIAFGRNTTASGDNSTALGFQTTASGFASTAMGEGSTATGQNSTAMGLSTVASAYNSTAMGANTLASGLESTAMGFHTVASGNLSTAMGALASTNSQEGSFVYGDRSDFLDPVRATAPNQFVVRAQNFWFGKSNTVIATQNRFIETSTGAYLSSGGAWTNSSDVNRKHLFESTSGEDVLSLLSAMPVQRWSYRAEDDSVRHLGPTAQDFYAAFHLGASETAIATVDADGVSLLAIQALGKRTRDLQVENSRLLAENARQAARLDALAAAVTRLEATMRQP